jgi:uncharacterized protein (DUF305 family)
MSTDLGPDVTDRSGDVEPDAEVFDGGRRLIVVLLCVLAVAALVVAGTAGYLIGNNSSRNTVSATSVDAGFARDMSAHHAQATAMAGYTRDHTSNSAIKVLAFDIESAQYTEIGEMQGWLDSWGLSRSSTIPQMAWMGGHEHVGADGLMPGMATEAQLTKLYTLTGTQLDVFFLQLMIHHHQGGVTMAQYAAQHASTSYVQNLAQKMYQNQSNEIVQMEQLLRSMGASPLPPPAS